jgi:hypothetical protein
VRSWRVLFVLGSVLLLLAIGVWGVSGQGDGEDQFEEVPITTTATDSVGVGSYVAAEAYAVPAGEDPAEQPVQPFIFPYGIYPALHIQMIEDFEQPDPAVEGFEFEWSLEAPEGSATELISGTVAIFQADVGGEYVLSLTATDADGNSGTTEWHVFAATYNGVGGLGSTAPEFPQCGTCHVDQGRAWYGTAHASYFTRMINGELGIEADAVCIGCATTGFNNRPEADNGGFDDLAREAGWMFPDVLEPGNWQAMLDDFPEAAAMANIQCESCHGPGSLHTTAGQEAENKMIGTGMDFGTCAQCHAVDPEHAIPEQWMLSAHADKNARAFWYPIGEDRQACVGCHSGLGYIDAASGVPMEERRTDFQTITCAVCHDPHDASSPNQLRVFDSVTLPDGTDVTAAGPAATCMTCHNGRTDPVASVEAAVAGEGLSTPHYSTAAELMNDTGGFTWGETLPSSGHGQEVPGACIGCHMAETPDMDDMGVGQHTFAMVSADGVEHVEVCQQCHGEVENFAFESFFDHDGDGAAEDHKAEVDGLLELVQAQLEAQGVVILDHHPYFEIPEDAGEDLFAGVYNFKFARDDASAYHNFKYVVSLLQLTYEKLAGEPVPGAEILAPQ